MIISLVGKLSKFIKLIVMDHHHEDGCCKSSGSSVSQTLEEMDFHRGIWYAAQTNDLERVKKLLNKGIPSSKVDSAGYTALHYAARNGNYDICKYLLNYGANVNAVTRCGQATALHRAASQSNDNIIQLLLKFKADPNLQDSDGYTALHRAASVDSRTTWNILSPLTDKNLRDNNGKTASDLLNNKDEIKES